LVSGLSTGLIFGLFWLQPGLISVLIGESDRLISPQISPQIIGLISLINGLTGGLYGWFQKGGSAWLKHYVLRFLLWRNDYAPLNYIRFLDYAAERVFLRKVGGGYIFTHRLLMEYFATLEPTKQAGQVKAEQPQ
jgi:hypothetical protein